MTHARYKRIGRPRHTASLADLTQVGAAAIAVATLALSSPAMPAEGTTPSKSGQARSGDRSFPSTNISTNVATKPDLPLLPDDSLSPSQATTYTYELDGQTVTTVYLQGLPIVTFAQPNTADSIDEVSGKDDTQAPSDLAETSGDRATELAAQLERLQQQSIDGEDIAATLDESTFTISIQDKPVIEYDQYVVNHPGHDRASSVLMATNRLRRTLADAPPLSSLPGSPTPSSPSSVSSAAVFHGVASWYGPGFAGRLAANGEVYNPENLTAAHKTLPFGTVVEVTNPNNGRSVVVEITDRGPYIAGRSIDLSTAAARTIGLLQSGVGPVQLRIISP